MTLLLHRPSWYLRVLWLLYGGDVSSRGLLGCDAVWCFRGPSCLHLQGKDRGSANLWNTTRRHNPEDLDLNLHDTYAFLHKLHKMRAWWRCRVCRSVLRPWLCTANVTPNAARFVWIQYQPLIHMQLIPNLTDFLINYSRTKNWCV